MIERKYNAKYYFGTIETADEAVLIPTDCGKMFLLLALMQAAMAYFVNVGAAFDAIAYALLGALLWKFRSRAAALALLVLSLAAIYITWMNVIGRGSGGRNIVLSILVFWFSIRAVQATFKLSKLKKMQVVQTDQS